MEAQIIKPRKVLKFSYRAEFYGNSDNAGAYLFYAKDFSKVTVFDKAFKQLTSFATGFKKQKSAIGTSAFCLHPNNALIAMVEPGTALHITDFNGKPLKTIPGSYEAALWQKSGVLWAIKRLGPENLLWQAISDGGELLQETSLTDSLYQSMLTLKAVPKSNDMLLELAAGQDGSTVLLLKAGQKRWHAEDLFPELCLMCPEFSLDSKRILTLDFYEGVLREYTWPKLEPLGAYHFSDDLFCSGFYFYAGDHQAFVLVDPGYGYLLNLESMQLEKELIIKTPDSEIESVQACGELVFVKDSEKENEVLVFDRADFNLS
ncbi:MAG: hypothetical protein LBR25_03570 [Erysipelotrichaceae bacterium]|jgi:hypothetical protein|nr:hypothetical protein [Erysipelotrichaceae bacterium]